MEQVFEFPAGRRMDADCGPAEAIGDDNCVDWLGPRISFSTGFADVREQGFLFTEASSSGSTSSSTLASGSGDGEEDRFSLDVGESSCSDFEFMVANGGGEESELLSQGFMLPADELFFQGKLLPLHQSRRTQMVELLSSEVPSCGKTGAGGARIPSAVHTAVHYLSSPSPFPHPVADTSGQPVRCPAEESMRYPFPYPIATSCCPPDLRRAYQPSPSPRCHRSRSWKAVFGSFRNKSKKSGGEESKHVCLAKAARTKVLRIFFRGRGPGVHRHRPVHGTCMDACVSESNDKPTGSLLPHSPTPAGCCQVSQAEDNYPRASKPREDGSPARRYLGRGSPGRFGRNGAVGKIVLKNLERVSRPATTRAGPPRSREAFVKASDKPGGLYTSSVRVTPVLNVPSVCIKPASFRSSKSPPSKGGQANWRLLFSRKDPPSLLGT